MSKGIGMFSGDLGELAKVLWKLSGCLGPLGLGAGLFARDLECLARTFHTPQFHLGQLTKGVIKFSRDSGSSRMAPQKRSELAGKSYVTPLKCSSKVFERRRKVFRRFGRADNSSFDLIKRPRTAGKRCRILVLKF